MPLRVAAVSDDLSSDFEDAARRARRLGVDGLAIRHVGGRNVADLDRTAVLDVSRVAAAYGLPIAAVSSPLGRGLSLEDDPGPALELLDRMVAYANLLGTDLVRFFACWISAKEAVDDWWERPDLTAALPRLVDRVNAFADRAERAGVRLMLELEGASYVGQVAEAERLLAALDSTSVGLCWDVCNGWWSGEHPVDGALPLATRLPLVDVQFKDVRARPGEPSRPDTVQVELGSGDIDYATIVAGLKASGYDGWCTAERVYHPRRPEVEPDLQDAMAVDLRELRSLVS